MFPVQSPCVPLNTHTGMILHMYFTRLHKTFALRNFFFLFYVSYGAEGNISYERERLVSCYRLQETKEKEKY